MKLARLINVGLVASVAGVALAALLAPPAVRTCRKCGCTDERACVWPDPLRPDASPMAWVACHWVERDLCSACRTDCEDDDGMTSPYV